jgi:hypothetical protein
LEAIQDWSNIFDQRWMLHIKKSWTEVHTLLVDHTCYLSGTFSLTNML